MVGIRQEMLDSITRYVEDGIEPGGFLFSVLANDLMEAMGRADLGNRAALFEICGYVYNDIPSTCHGSTEIVLAWLASGGLNGQRKAREQGEAQ